MVSEFGDNGREFQLLYCSPHVPPSAASFIRTNARLLPEKDRIGEFRRRVFEVLSAAERGTSSLSTKLLIMKLLYAAKKKGTDEVRQRDTAEARHKSVAA